MVIHKRTPYSLEPTLELALRNLSHFLSAWQDFSPHQFLTFLCMPDLNATLGRDDDVRFSPLNYEN
jgi:hypothetical protein